MQARTAGFSIQKFAPHQFPLPHLAPALPTHPHSNNSFANTHASPSLTERSHRDPKRHVRLAGIPLSTRLVTASRRHSTTGSIVVRGFWDVSHSVAAPRSNSNRAASPPPTQALAGNPSFLAASRQGEDIGSSQHRALCVPFLQSRCSTSL
jgi:hypothetical protein